nr:hypothetical protein [Myxococcales bacterium]
ASALASTVTSESFGDDIISTCDPQWYGDCQEDWNGYGVNDSLDLCEDDTVTPSNWFVGIEGAASPNGVGTSLDLPTDQEYVEASVLLQTTGTGDVGLRMVFRNGSGSILAAKSHWFSVEDGKEYILDFVETAPAGSASVDAEVYSGSIGLTLLVDVVDLTQNVNTTAAETQAECDDWADTIYNKKKDACEDKGGSFSGSCTGKPKPDGGCNIKCDTDCKVLVGVLDPADTCAAF